MFREKAGAAVVQVNQYSILHEIGRGSYGSVKVAVNNDDGKEYAIKIISKARLRQRKQHKKIAEKRTVISAGADAATVSSDSPITTPETDVFFELRKEIAVLKKLSSHPHCVRLVEFLDDKEEDLVYMGALLVHCATISDVHCAVFELCQKGPVMKISASRVADPLPEDRARRYFRQIILGLEYCT